MADRQISAMTFAPWIDSYLAPDNGTYSAAQGNPSPAAPASWAAAMGARAWAPPIFGSQLWPAVPSPDAPENLYAGAEGGSGNVSVAHQHQLIELSTGILPYPTASAPEVPLSTPNGPIFLSQLTYPPETPRSWRQKFLDASSLENIRYYMGPGFYDSFEKFLPIAAALSPGPGVRQAHSDALNGERALKDLDFGQAALDYGKSVINLGTSLIPEMGPALGKLAIAGSKSAAAGLKAIFAGVMAKTAQMDRLGTAAAMERAGKPIEEILRATGWFRDPLDRKWRFEIPDDKMLFTTDGDWGVGGPFSSLQHPELKKAYPNLRHVYIGYTPEPNAPSRFVSQSDFGTPTFQKPTEIQVTGPRSERHAMTVHELQHAVGDIEDFARGGNPANAFDPMELEKAKILLRRADELKSQGKLNDAALADTRAYSVLHSATNFDNYWRLAGEVEARNAAARALLTPEQRRAIPPWETIDRDVMPPIVRFRVPPPLPQTPDWSGYQGLVEGLRKLGLL